METSLEVNVHAWKLPGVGRRIVISIEISMEVAGRRFASTEVSVNFHRSTWKFPLPVEVEDSIASINCSFHEYIPWKLPWASTYSYIFAPTSASVTTCSSFHKFNLHPVLNHNVELPPSKLAYFQLPRKQMEVHRSDPMKVGGSFHGSWYTCMEVSGSFHGSRWKLPWK